MQVERRESKVERRRAEGFIPTDCPARRGFTLTELLVVMVILVILTTMTVYAVNFTLAAERSRAAARQVQSYLEGARDRAIYESRAAGEIGEHPVGVRFLLDPNISNGGNLVTASSMVFVEEVSPAPTGFLEFIGTSRTVATQRSPTSGAFSWESLFNKGLLPSGTTIKIPDDDFGFWYVLSYDSPSRNIILSSPFRIQMPSGEYSYQLRLPPVIRPNQEPMLLPRGIVIDLDRSQVPSYWRRPGGGYINQLDIMFSPRGTIMGRAASGGLIHFYLADAADVDRLNQLQSGNPFIPSDTPYGTASGDDVIGDRLIVTLFPQTGAISSHPVDVTDVLPLGSPDGIPDDPFRYAETGEVAAE